MAGGLPDTVGGIPLGKRSRAARWLSGHGWRFEGIGRYRQLKLWSHPLFAITVPQGEALVRQAQHNRRVEDKRSNSQDAQAQETARFSNRLRFDHSWFWDWNRPPEAKSPIPSTWPAFAEAVRIWGVGRYRPYEWKRSDPALQRRGARSTAPAGS